LSAIRRDGSLPADWIRIGAVPCHGAVLRAMSRLRIRFSYCTTRRGTSRIATRLTGSIAQCVVRSEPTTRTRHGAP
jgi:hypothetical protein